MLIPAIQIAVPMSGFDLNDSPKVEWHPLGFLWGAWVFRPGGKKSDGSDDDVERLGRFWRLPESDAEVGLKKLEEWVRDDREEVTLEVRLANPTDPHLTEPRKPLVEENIPLGKPPIVRLVKRSHDELVIGWKADSDDAKTLPAVVEVLMDSTDTKKGKKGDAAGATGSMAGGGGGAEGGTEGGAEEGGKENEKEEGFNGSSVGERWGMDRSVDSTISRFRCTIVRVSV